MNKSDLVDAVAGRADMSKAEAGRAVDAVLGSVGDALGNGDSVSLVGFGTFSVTFLNPSISSEKHINFVAFPVR